MKMICASKYSLRRKLSRLSPCFIGLILFILLCCKGYYTFNSSKFLPVEEVDFDVEKSSLKKAHKKISFLTSLLKRWKVPEREYTEDLPRIYVITPTYARPVQKAELTRLKNVFIQVPALHWIVVEDAETPTKLVSNFLSSSGISSTHLSQETPSAWKLLPKEPKWRKPRGVLQRNLGIKWIRNNVMDSDEGVVYFADDDNTYSIELFDEMRYTKKVSIWPVGLVGGVMVERPSLDTRGRVNGWKVGWRPNRSFATDMAGFAVAVNLLLRNPKVYFSHESQIGYLESDFLEQLVKREDLEPKADRCSKVLVWHTQTKDPNFTAEGSRSTNEDIEV